MNIKKEIFKLFTFAATGFVSASIDCVVYYILLNFTNINFRLIQPISMSVGLCCSFLLNRNIAFKNERNSLSIELIKYLLVCSVCVALSPIIISIYHIWFGKYLVKIPATLTLGLVNYLLNRFFVYNKLSTQKKEGSDNEIL